MEILFAFISGIGLVLFVLIIILLFKLYSLLSEFLRLVINELDKEN